MNVHPKGGEGPQVNIHLLGRTSHTYRQDTGWFLIASRINCKRYWLPLVHLIASRWGSLSTPCSETWKSRLHKKCQIRVGLSRHLKGLWHMSSACSKFQNPFKSLLKAFQVPAQSLSSACSKALKCLLEHQGHFGRAVKASAC